MERGVADEGHEAEDSPSLDPVTTVLSRQLRRALIHSNYVYRPRTSSPSSPIPPARAPRARGGARTPAPASPAERWRASPAPAPATLFSAYTPRTPPHQRSQPPRRTIRPRRHPRPCRARRRRRGRPPAFSRSPRPRSRAAARGRRALRTNTAAPSASSRRTRR